MTMWCVWAKVPAAKNMLIDCGAINDPGQSTSQQAAECRSYRSTVARQIEKATRTARCEATENRRCNAFGPRPTRRQPWRRRSTAPAIGDGERLAGHSAIAEDYFRRSSRNMREVGRERGPMTTVIRNNLAMVYDGTGGTRNMPSSSTMDTSPNSRQDESFSIAAW